MQALEAGAEDVQEDEGESTVYTDPKELAKVRDALKEAGIEVTEADLSFEPNTTVDLDDEKQDKAFALLEALEDLDDVVNTYTNLS